MKQDLKISVSVALPIEVLPKLESQARARGLTRSGYLREIVLESLERRTDTKSGDEMSEPTRRRSP